MSTESPYHFAHLLQVLKQSLHVFPHVYYRASTNFQNQEVQDFSHPNLEVRLMKLEQRNTKKSAFFLVLRGPVSKLWNLDFI